VKLNKPAFSVLIGAVVIAAGIILIANLANDRSAPEQPAAARQPSGSDSKPTDPKAFTRLSEEKQDYLWLIEHWAFELEQKFGTTFMRAIEGNDTGRLTQLTLPGFVAKLPDPSTETSVQHKFLTERTRHATRDHEARVTSAQWANHISGLLKAFDKIEGSKLRVLHIDREEQNENLWHVELLIAATGSANDGSRVSMESIHRVHCRFKREEDIKAGQILELWVVQSETFRTSGAQLFEEVAEKAGLAELPLYDNWKVTPEYAQFYTAQMAVDDFNRDGFLDIAVAGLDGVPRLLWSIRGERYKDVAAKLGLHPWHTDTEFSTDSMLATWIDYDNDEYPDLLMGKSLYRNVDGEQFEDVTESSGLKIGYDPMGAAVADYDGDGLLDLYILYQHFEHTKGELTDGYVGDNQSGAPNQLWKNMGQGRFMDVTASTGTDGGPRRSFAATWFHANDDHHPDLYVANDFGHNVLLINDGTEKFRDAGGGSGIEDYSTSMGVVSGDLDNNGSLELYVANMYSKMGLRIMAHVSEQDYPPGMYAQILGSAEGNRLYSPGIGGKRYDDKSLSAGVNEIGWAHAPAFVDLDSDGLLDIYATTGFMSFNRGRPDG